MAATYTAFTASALSTGIPWATSKYMFLLYNSAAQVLRIYRIWCLNYGTGTVTGGVGQLEISRIITSVTGGTTVTPINHDTASGALSGVTCVYGATSVGSKTDIFRKVYVPTDEVVLSTGHWEDLAIFWPLQCIFDAGYGDNSVGIEPLTCRQNEGIALYANASSIAAGTCDMAMEFTVV
jgi:hypothetical protein